MVNIQVRDVPEELRNTLAAEAKERGQSMQAYLLTLFEEAGRRTRAIAMLRRLDSMGGGYSGPGSDAVEEIAEQRAERDRRILGEA
ncbi:FitA-like ribbon-helix-helix domain-containing protein [Glycomyces sp. MUSA5-2]|uniref:FitA-like ribbon-helix-helix domain-containing protein n=1 Tax=Glycomyces sp. MUSA5-2 TaxID=2053002 RepID=UPI00300A0FC4